MLHNSMQASHGTFCEEYLVSLKWHINDEELYKNHLALNIRSLTQRHCVTESVEDHGEKIETLINFIKRRKSKCHFRESRALRLNSLICKRISLQYSSLNISRFCCKCYMLYVHSKKMLLETQLINIVESTLW